MVEATPPSRQTGAGRRTKGERTREAIMAAATELFRERGFRETSLGDIGAAAGVSGPAIYRYFKSKGELLSVLIEEAAITWRETVDDVLNEDTPPLVTLERLIDAAIVLQLQERQPARRLRQGVPLARRRCPAAGGPHRAGAHGRVGAPALRGPARPDRRGGAGRRDHGRRHAALHHLAQRRRTRTSWRG